MGAQPARARWLAAVCPPVARDVAGASSRMGSKGVARPGGPPGRPPPRRAGRGRVRHHEAVALRRPRGRRGRRPPH
eukprot:7112492-Lingulodinium_polyedra.AAC.1